MYEWQPHDLPEVVDFTYARGWLAEVLEGYCIAAQNSARAAVFICDHLPAVESTDTRMFALTKRMRDSADRATYNADQAAKLLELLPAVEDHVEGAAMTAELCARAFDAGLHLATVVGLLRFPDPGEPGFGLPLVNPEDS